MIWSSRWPAGIEPAASTTRVTVTAACASVPEDACRLASADMVEIVLPDGE
jgi:hypothetical protein